MPYDTSNIMKMYKPLLIRFSQINKFWVLRIFDGRENRASKP